MIAEQETSARTVAEAELLRLGFTRTSNGHWRESLAEVPLTIDLPPGFPHVLPVITVDRTALPRPVPHVERNGKICIAPSTGVLIDAKRPAALVRESVQRAQRVLAEGLIGTNESDWYLEFEAYWPDSDARIVSFCNPEGPARRVTVGVLDRTRRPPTFVVTDTAEDLTTVVNRTEWPLQRIDSAYFVPLRSRLRPPAFNTRLTLSDLGVIMRTQVSTETRHVVLRWLSRAHRRQLLLFTFRIDETNGRACFAVRTKSPIPVIKGFRPGRAPLVWALTNSKEMVTNRLQLQRADKSFLRRRTGSAVDFQDKRVMIVGCGAVGGYLAACLADSGFGKLTLVDNDVMKPENAMRHILGLADTGRAKVEALRDHLQRRLPELEVERCEMTIEALLLKEPGVAQRHDLVVFATGDQSLELRLSTRLRSIVPLVHVWVEAHGVGGHVLVDGAPARGCLACLFEADAVNGLVCRASLCAPGQEFTMSVAGCAGTFTPFGAMDAQRAAIEAARLSVRRMSTPSHNSVLTTWVQSKAAFEDGRLIPSERGRNLVDGVRVEVTSHAVGCPTCR